MIKCSTPNMEYEFGIASNIDNKVNIIFVFLWLNDVFSYFKI